MTGSDPLHIAIDARWIFPEISGIGGYARELIAALARVDSENRYTLIFDRDDVRRRTMDEAGVAHLDRIRSLLVPYGVFSLRNQWSMPRLLRRERVRVYHSPNYMIPLAAFPRRRAGAVRCVTTVHDVIPMIFPQSAPRSRKARLYPLYRRLMVEVGMRSDLIITDSEASRRDILRHLRIPTERQTAVRVIPCGVAARLVSRVPRPPLPEGEDRTRSLLYVGRLDPYKNVPTLIRVLARVRETVGFRVVLKVAGSPDPRYPEAARLAWDLGVSDAVEWLGYLTDEELAETYGACDVLVHASRYEGFGLQVLEAMANGLPVVCSTGGAIPEVVGEAALRVDPDDVEGFVAAVRRVLTDRALAEGMRQDGLKQAASFPWEKTAEQTLRAYKEVSA